MLLAINANNTNTVFAVWDGAKLKGAWRAATDAHRTSDQYVVWLDHLLALDGLSRAKIDRAIIASVVPEANFNLRRLCREYCKTEPLIVGEKGVDIGAKALVDQAAEVGADRLVNTVAAHDLYKGPLIVVDFGTATTFDVVDGDGNYRGGVIAPGINLSLQALHLAAAKLPSVPIRRTQKVNLLGICRTGRRHRRAHPQGIRVEDEDRGNRGIVGLVRGCDPGDRARRPQPDPVGALPDRRTQSQTRAQGQAQGMNSSAAPAPNRPDELAFLALGGVGEIGMNLSLYGYMGRWLMVDCGISFADDTLPGVDIVMPDPAFIAERAETLDGLIVTHAHEDHIGAIQYLWSRLRCPVYATPFTAAVLRLKLLEAGLEREVPITEVPLSGKFAVGPFEIELITLTHSIPEPNALVLRTPLGAVLHTGDWKFDPDPLVGDISDMAALQCLGNEGVLAMVCDSTNALRPGEAGSESLVRKALIELIGTKKNRVAVACFASNVARLESIAEAARIHGRHAALVGRSLWRIEHAARETGYLAGVTPFLTEEEASYLPREKALLICTGSQGEPRSALTRIAADEHPEIVLEEGDCTIFSSRVIPGNERAIGRLQNALAQLGVEIVTERDAPIHVSGHPAQNELIRMYQTVRPRIAVPVHGEARHLLAQARLAEQCQVPQTIVTRNGEVVKLAPGPASVVGEVPSGRLVLDGNALLDARGETLKNRQRMVFNGAALVSIIMDMAGRLLAPPAVTVEGLAVTDNHTGLGERIRQAIEEMSPRERRDDDAVREAMRLAVRRSLKDWHGKKPVTRVHLVRLGQGVT
jgi:ribonuclease J